MPTAPPHRPIAGIALRLIAMLALAVMFVIVKMLAARGVSLIESLFYRQLFALPLVAGTAVALGGAASLRTRRLSAHGFRALTGIAGMGLNFSAMILLPMAEATTVSLAVPIIGTILAAVLLGEPTGWRRWLAVLAGFAGVLMVLQPGGDQFHAVGAAVALAGAAVTAFISIQVRDLGRTEPAMTSVFWFSALSLVPLGCAMVYFAQTHSPGTWAMLGALGLAGGVAQMALTGALRFAPVSVVLPMDYSALIWSSLLGVVVFAQAPLPGTWIGAPLIVASGLYIAWRERRLMIARGADPAV